MARLVLGGHVRTHPLPWIFMRNPLTQRNLTDVLLMSAGRPPLIFELKTLFRMSARTEKRVRFMSRGHGSEEKRSTRIDAATAMGHCERARTDDSPNA